MGGGGAGGMGAMGGSASSRLALVAETPELRAAVDALPPADDDPEIDVAAETRTTSSSDACCSMVSLIIWSMSAVPIGSFVRWESAARSWAILRTSSSVSLRRSRPSSAT